MYRLLVFFSFLIIFSNAANAGALQKKTALHAAQLKMDTSRINIRSFDPAALKNYKSDPGFNYHTSTVAEDSIWDRFWNWFWHLIESLFSSGSTSPKGSSPIMKYLVIAIVVGFIVYLITKMTGVSGIFNLRSKKIDIPFAESVENIHSINFEDDIQNAIRLGNYRLAVRLLYLNSLKQLSDAGLINWQMEKTNSAYLNELISAELKQPFRLLTLQFEYIWYGNFPIDRNSFQKIYSSFANFRKTMP